MTIQPCPHDPAAIPGKASQRSEPTGLIAGAVLRSARRSADLSPAQLAAAAGFDQATVTSWESGTEPLASAPSPVVEQLESALSKAGAAPELIRDLAIAAWCDLLLQGIVAGEDVSCLLADPLAWTHAFGELLAWAITGQPPVRHFPYAGHGRLLPTAEPGLIARVVLALNSLSPRQHAA
jgi:DNA-binding transcriptional regulator YiaG